MTVDAYASERQYADHLAPIWRALPERGTFWVTGALADRPPEGIDVRVGWPPGTPGVPVLVASYQDHRTCGMVGSPTIYLEHGAGQTYGGDAVAAVNPSYSGGPDHEDTVLFLCPSERVADRWRRRYPTIPAVAVGCPKLDGWWGRGRPTDGRTVAISFHSDVRLCPETASTWSHYRIGLPSAVRCLQADGWTVLGHGHPRMWGRMGVEWGRMGVEPVERFEEVLERADVYVCDNSSTLYEAAAIGIPVVALNAPWYRRHVHHGLRFWDMIPGICCDYVDGLPSAIDAALADPPEVRASRERIVREVYAHLDGSSTERAVLAIRAATDPTA